MMYYFWVLQKNNMFIRELKNRSGSVSIQIISKARGRYKVVKTIGCAQHGKKLNA